MKYIAREQIKQLFTNPIETMTYGLYFSGYEGEGERKDWHYDGKLWIHCFYKDGKLNGEFKSWYRNGKLDSHLIYKDGEVVKDYLK